MLADGVAMISEDTPLDAVTFAVVDVETTGLDPASGDRVCELAVVRGQAGRVLDSWSTLIHPQRPIPPGVQRINHISDAMVRDAPPFAGVVPEFLARLADTVLVAHFAAFDLGFLRHELARLDLAADRAARRWWWIPARWPAAAIAFPTTAWASWRPPCGVRDPGPAHRALADVLSTWGVLTWFLADLRAPGRRLDTLGDLLALQGSLDRDSRRAFGATPRPPLPPEAVPRRRGRGHGAGPPLRTRYMGADGRLSERRITPRRVTIERETLYVVAYLPPAPGGAHLPPGPAGSARVEE